MELEAKTIKQGRRRIRHSKWSQRGLLAAAVATPFTVGPILTDGQSNGVIAATAGLAAAESAYTNWRLKAGKPRLEDLYTAAANGLSKVAAGFGVIALLEVPDMVASERDPYILGGLAGVAGAIIADRVVSAVQIVGFAEQHRMSGPIGIVRSPDGQ